MKIILCAVLAFCMALPAIAQRGTKYYGENQVFTVFPSDSLLFKEDVRPFMRQIIRRHGLTEWRAGAITCELHGHTGIYAIVGMKMGILAREYFEIGLDDIEIVSYAGYKTPLSCLNDGLQVATGATLGHGLIKVSQDESKRPEAVFTFEGKTIRIRLKDEYVKKIENDVLEGLTMDGNFTDTYWGYIRKLALRYWLEFDRRKIFITQEIH